MAKMILFGGSFDPIHNGHLIVARAAMEQCRAAGVLFVPAQVSPHKTDQAMTDGKHRLRMISLAISGEPGWAVSAMELKRTGPSYTWDTLRSLENSQPQHQFVLLLGQDQLAGLGSWYCAEELLTRVDLAVSPRGDTPGRKIPRPAGLTGKTWRKVLAAVIDAPRIDISATDIRRRVRRGLSIRYLVPETVERHIRRWRLYVD